MSLYKSMSAYNIICSSDLEDEEGSVIYVDFEDVLMTDNDNEWQWSNLLTPVRNWGWVSSVNILVYLSSYY